MSWEDEVRLKVIDTQTGKRFDVSPKAFKQLYIDHGSRIQLDGTEGANADYAWVGYGKSTPSDTGGERYGQDPIELPEYHTQPFSRDPSTFKDSDMGSLKRFADMQRDLQSGTFSRDPSTFKESNMNSLLNASRGDLLRSGTFSRDPSTFKDSEMGSLGNAAHEDLLRSGGWQYNDNAFGPDTNAILNKSYTPSPKRQQEPSIWSDAYGSLNSIYDKYSPQLESIWNNVPDMPTPDAFSAGEHVLDNYAQPVQNFFGGALQGMSTAYDDVSDEVGTFYNNMSNYRSTAAKGEKAREHIKSYKMKDLKKRFPGKTDWWYERKYESENGLWSKVMSIFD